MSDVAADWYPDPSGKFEFRYWDGETWTGHVSSGGETSWDPPPDAPAGDGGSGAAVADVGMADAGTGAAGAGSAGTAGAASAVDALPAADDLVNAELAGVTEMPTAEANAYEPWAAGASAGAGGGLGASAPGGDGGGHDEWAPQGTGGAVPATAGTATATTGTDLEDSNLVAIERAGIPPESADWLRKVAAQVQPRLDRINGSWSQLPQAEAARACAFGLLLGHLATLHPHMRDDLGAAAEAHPSFSTLDAGSRLQTLEQIAQERTRAAQWLGPLIDVDDVGRVSMLFD